MHDGLIPMTKELYMNFLEASSKEFQQKVWIEDAIKNYISFYDELRMFFFDVYDIDKLTSEWGYELGFGEELMNELRVFSKMLHNHDGYDKDMREILNNDPEWDKIVEQAKKIVRLWDNDPEAKKYRYIPEPMRKFFEQNKLS